VVWLKGEDMNIKTEKVLRSYEYERNVAVYSKHDIEELIIKDMIDKGFFVERITFDIETKYVADEWGMNQTQTTVLNGAKVVIQNT